MGQDGPQRLQDGPKMAQGGPKMAQGRNNLAQVPGKRGQQNHLAKLLGESVPLDKARPLLLAYLRPNTNPPGPTAQRRVDGIEVRY